MKTMSLKHRLILPIALLGILALLSNIISICNIRNVNASASTPIIIWTAKAIWQKSASPP